MLVPSKEFKTSLEIATSRFQTDLEGPEGRRGLQFLTDRGITRQAMDYFRLGYVLDPEPEFMRFQGMISIPYITRGGIVSIRFRAVPDDEGNLRTSKYLSLHGAAGMSRIYNTRAFDRPERFICVCEGEFDTMVAAMCGLPAVGFPGAKNWRKEFAGMFRYRTTYVLADNDDKGDGINFSERIAEDVHDTRIIIMPRGHDVNSYYTDNGREALLAVTGLGAS